MIANDDGSIEVVCAPGDFDAVRKGLEQAGLKAEVAEVTMKALSATELDAEESVKMQKLLDAIEDCDDVQEVYTTAVLSG